MAEPAEVEYADVSILKRQKQLGQRERREETVEYGELNIQKDHTPMEEEKCPVYVKVKTTHNRVQSQTHLV